MLVSGLSFSQQITVDDSVSPEDLIQQHLVAGCVEASNVTSPINGSINNITSYGYFEKANSNFPFENGIVLTSGMASKIGNTEDNSIITSGNYDWGTDPAIETALGINNTLNATTIQFQFVSITDRIEFNYILASEEYYANFPCAFSDGFAFLIREAGTNDSYQNIAIVPNTNTPVNTTTIRPEISGFCEASNDEYFAGFNLGDTNFNGRTEVLTAVADIKPYVLYDIKLIVSDQNDTNYDTAVFIEGNSFGSAIELGDDFQTCASQVVLNGDINNSNANYTWYLDNQIIDGANSPSYAATTSGNYRVEASIAISSSSCVLTDDINLIIDSAQNAEPISDYILCDSNSNGIQNFDIMSKSEEVLNSVMPSNYEISFHLSLDDAQGLINPIEGNINNTSNPQIIYTRINDLNSGCIIYSTFNLIVTELPQAPTLSPVEICASSDLNGQAAIDLTIKDDEILAGNSAELNLSYHASQEEALSGENALVTPYVNSLRNEIIYVRIQDTETQCINTTSFAINIIDEPEINTSERLLLDACDLDHDGNAVFNLLDIIPQAIPNIQGLTITFFESEEDANANINEIQNPSNFANTQENVQIVFIRAENTNTGCYSTAPLELHTNLLLTATNIRNINVCDEDGNGVEDFFFNTIALGIINNIPGVTVTFHLTEDDRDNKINPINTDQVFVNTDNPQTIYLNLYSDTCEDTSEIDLIVNPVIEFESVNTLYVCDEDQDGLTILDLSEFDSDVTFGDDGFSVTYYLTEEDARAKTNALPRFYENTTNPLQLFPSIESNDTGCSTSNSFEVVVRPAPITNTPETIIICDMDMDGFHILNLNTIISEVVDSTENREITFHNSQSDAGSGENPIVDTTSYNAQTETVHIRVVNTSTGCISLEQLEIIVNTFPVIGNEGLVDTYLICEDASDGIADFIFETRDEEIIGSQNGKEAHYYLSLSDAENRQNPIDKTNGFSNTVNPQTIFVRLENTSDTSCFTTGQFEIYVSTNPEFNDPSDIIICDDISNDGSEIIDFESKITEITEGFPDIQLVTFHTSQAEAISGANALPEGYQNFTNPQQIFARIDDGSECQSITSFVFTVLQAPTVSMPQSLEACDNDLDGYETFDLTLSEFDIFDIRQDDIVVDYFVTYDQADENSNAISDPENYVHDTSSGEVFIRVTNTVSNCYVILPIELIINLPPELNYIETYEVCSNDEQNVDLTLITPLIIENTSGISFSYYSSQEDAEANENALDDIYYYTSITENLYIKAVNTTTGCYDIHRFKLQLNLKPKAHQIPGLEYCDDDYDGLLDIDLSVQSSLILGQQSPDLIQLTYHENEADALSGENPLDTNYLAINGDIIYARTENRNTGCIDTSSFDITINELPIIDVDDQVICLENLPLVVSADTGNATDSYLWSTGEVTSEIEITEIGDYWVTVTTEHGCETSKPFNVSVSEAATIEFTEVVDFSDPNNVTITVSGIGDYLYILDDGEPQESNVFENVGLGYHIITIIDENGCSPITKEVLVIDTPKFFTPNNDGQFDTWHIVGVETLPGTEIFIYNRYGKLLKRIAWNTAGWDGSFNGADLPSNDYWFVANVRRGEMAFEVKGHFSLRR